VKKKPLQMLHCITTGDQSLPRVMQAAKAIWPWITCLHVREKNRSEQELAEWLAALIDAGIPPDRLVLNGHPALAARFRLRGVQLSERETRVRLIKRRYPALTVGASVHSLSAAAQRARQGADYVMFGNVYETSCKPGCPGRGIDALETIALHIDCPVIAVGGVTAQRVPELIRAGAAGVAVRSGIMQAADPFGAVKAYRWALD
jgi:thiazole tautomerase (transcriptional regulator TenI)